MTKLFFTALSALTFTVFAQSPFNFNVNGIVRNVGDNSFIYIHHKWDNKDVTDSAKVKAGKFTFNGKSSEVNMYWITKSRNMNEQPNLIFFADPGKITINANIDSLPMAIVNGGQTQTDYKD